MSSGWDDDPWEYQPKRQRKEKGTVFITHFPRGRPPSAILDALRKDIERRGGESIFEESQVTDDGKGIFITVKQGLDSVLASNGMFVFNQRLWIMKYNEAHTGLCGALLSLYKSSVASGQVDLSRLKQKLISAGADKSVTRFVDFNNRDFVEVTLFLLGTDSVENDYLIETLILSDNDIHDAFILTPFLPFLPTLRTIVLTGNPIKKQPTWSYIQVVCREKSPTKEPRRYHSNE